MPPLSFHPNKSGALIASTLGEVDSAFYAEDGGVKVHQTQKIHGNRRHETVKPNLVGRCAHTPPPQYKTAGHHLMAVPQN